MGLVYDIPVIPGLVEGTYYGSSLPSNLSSSYNAVVDNGFHDGINLNYDSSHYFTAYIGADSQGVKVAFWNNNGKLQREGVVPSGSHYFIASKYTVMTWYGYNYSNGVDGQFPSSDTGVTIGSTTLDYFDTQEAALSALGLGTRYPITYSYTNSTVSGPSEAAVGDTVTVSAVPDNNYGITDPATQIVVTNNDVAVSYNWNPSTNTIMFVMPDHT